VRPAGRRRAALILMIATCLLVSTFDAVGADTLSRTDGNDTPGPLDIRLVSVRHEMDNVVHRIVTFSGWNASDLGSDSVFVIAIDRNGDRRFDRCAFIYYRAHLRGSLTNCWHQVFRSLEVGKRSRNAVWIKIPTADTNDQYRWAGFSDYSGPAPCADVCSDVVPNRYPLMLHDFLPPEVSLSNTQLREWRGSTTTQYRFPFVVSDGPSGSGVASWKVQRARLGSGGWTTIVEGKGDGPRSPSMVGSAGAWKQRIVAIDGRGNQTISRERAVLIPTDVADVDDGAFTGIPTTIYDTDAYLGTYVELDVGESYEVTLDPLGNCGYVYMIGPGGGDWVVDVAANNVPITTLTAESFAPGQRRTLYEGGGCSATTYTFTVTGGSGFGVDAVLTWF
jgi:hypothetical protein